jgi:hypothetical protein
MHCTVIFLPIVSGNNVKGMIIIVYYGSILPPFSNNWADMADSCLIESFI